MMDISTENPQIFWSFTACACKKSQANLINGEMYQNSHE